MHEKVNKLNDTWNLFNDKDNSVKCEDDSVKPDVSDISLTSSVLWYHEEFDATLFPNRFIFI